MHSPKRRKRSTTLTLTTVMASSALALTACDQPAPPPAQQQVEAAVYQSLDQCKLENKVPDEECDKGWQAAQNEWENAPRFAQQGSCEDLYGVGNCVPRQSGGGSWFVPALTGFMIGQMLNDFGDRRSYYRGSALYRDYRGGYVTGYGGRLTRDYATGRTTVSRGDIDYGARQAPTRVQSRTAAVSRSGFGGGMRGYGG